MGNADALSRLPLPEQPEAPSILVPGDIKLLFEHLSHSVVTASQIKSWTEKDPILARIHHFILHGWPDTPPSPPFQPYFNHREELTAVNGCILWGARVVIPPPGRQLVITQLHSTHPGICKMKSLARSYVWWPGMDTDIASTVQSCSICQQHRPSPPKAPLHPWEWPSHPWSRLHIDHAGPFMGKLFLILVDAHSKWLEVHVVPSTSAAATIDKLRAIFATFGLPDQIVSDNGPGFTSTEFQQFLSANGIRQTLTSPYHPSSNSLAERAVQTFKNAVVKLSGSIEKRLSQFLFQYRITPQSTTGVSPAQLLMGRRLRSHLDLLHPDTADRVMKKQEKSVTKRPLRQFELGEKVLVRNYNGPKRIKGKVVRITGPISYQVETENGWMRRHVDQLRRQFFEGNTDSNSNGVVSDDDDWIGHDHFSHNPPAPEASAPPAQADRPVPTRYSSRSRPPIDRYSPSRYT